MSAQTLYWHFVRVDEDGMPRLGYGDSRAVVVGETLTVVGEPELCRRGLHASARLWDALGYAEGDRLALCRVRLGGTVVEGDDKSAATERTVLAMLTPQETDKLLRDFARWCALQVVHLWGAPDVVRQYLETGDESLRDAAKVAAWAAARDAAWASARDAARDAAWSSTRDAARDAAWSSTRDAARAATRAVAEDSAKVASATRATTRTAAWDAAVTRAIWTHAEELERRGLAAIAATANSQHNNAAGN
jgi:hypothetical protein